MTDATADIRQQIQFVLPEGQSLEAVQAAKPLPPFSEPVIQFIENLGRGLRSDPASRRFPELVALGFWARRASVERLKQRFEQAYPHFVRMPRGLAFHVAPSNVDTIFVYSLLLSMLAGNVNLVRVSSRSGEQSGHLMTLLAKALAEAEPAIQQSVAIIRTPHDKPVIDWLSHASALRIIWGGDETVNRIRQSPLNPGGTELVFPNRASLAVIDAQAWMQHTDKGALARQFVNDSLWFGQMACSSPRDLVWRGSAADVATTSPDFWAHVEQQASLAGLEWVDAHAVAKLLAAQDLAAGETVEQLPQASNRITIVRPNQLSGLGTPSPTGAGFFREHVVADLNSLAPHIRRNWQSIASFGIASDDWRQFLLAHCPPGIDRIVKFGEALNFDAIWDGVDLLTAMTRLVAIHD